MAQVQLTVPDSVLAALKKAPHEVAAEIRLAAAVHWCQQGVLSVAHSTHRDHFVHGIVITRSRAS